MGKQTVQSVALPRIVDLDALEEIGETLIGALQSGPVEVEGEAVERISTNALFMLLSAAQTARQAGHGFSIANASAVLRSAIDKLGLEPAFAPVLKG